MSTFGWLPSVESPSRSVESIAAQVERAVKAAVADHEGVVIVIVNVPGAVR